MKKSSLLLMAFASMAAALNAETYKIPVGEFNELVLNDKLNVVYSTNPDSVGFVVFDTKPEYASYIMTESTKGKLKIQLAQEAQKADDLPTVYAYSTFLSKVENWREGNVTIKEIKPASAITLSTQGNGNITAYGLDATSISLKVQTGKGFIKATGKCRSLELYTIGAGSIDAYGIAAQEIDCRVTGTGSVYCTPSEKLKIRGLGTGKVYYNGNPAKIEKSGLTTVKAIKSEGEPAQEAEEETKQPVKNEAPQATPQVIDDVFEDNATPSERKPVRRPKTGKPESPATISEPESI